MKGIIYKTFTICNTIFTVLVIITATAFAYEKQAAPEAWVDYVAEVSTNDMYINEDVYILSFNYIRGQGAEWTATLWCDTSNGRGFTQVHHVTLIFDQYTSDRLSSFDLAKSIKNQSDVGSVQQSSLLRNIANDHEVVSWRWRGQYPIGASTCFTQNAYSTKTPIFGLDIEGVIISNKFTLIVTNDIFNSDSSTLLEEIQEDVDHGRINPGVNLINFNQD